MINAYILKDCYYSSQAFDLLKKSKIRFQYFEVPQDEKIKTSLKKQHKMKTFPQIIYELPSGKSTTIGGYSELVQYFNIIEQIKNEKLNKDFLIHLLQKK